MKILVTGGAGFIGSNLVHWLVENRPDDKILVLDSFTYAGHISNIPNNNNVGIVAANILHAKTLEYFMPEVDVIMHLAAETHVDNSISRPEEFVQTNIVGTHTLLTFAQKFGKRFLYVSTDEVMGSLGPTGYFTEETPLAPNSPYSASKASGEMLVRAYHKTYGTDVVITRCSNNYGPRQHEEKLIPNFLLKLLDGKKVPMYGDGKNVRDWLYVEDHCRALDLILRNGKSGEIYNIGGNCEKTNLEIAEWLIKKTGRSMDVIEFVQDRPGHDRRYAIDSSKIKRELNWEPKYDFETGMEKTYEWYLAKNSSK